MSEKVGIVNTIVVMDALLSVGGTIAEGLQDDGKFGIADSIKLAKNIPETLSAIHAAKEMPTELRDLDDEERAQIVAHFADKFDLPNDDLEERLERAFRVAVNLSAEVVEIVDLAKEFRG